MPPNALPGPHPPMRRLAQPGPVAPVRIQSCEGRSRTVTFPLEPGLTLNEAVTRPLLDHAIPGGTVTVEGGALAPFTYVIPAVSPDAEHAAYYSRLHRVTGETRIERADITVGWRDGAPFIHCHATWIEPDGSRRGGHVMPHDTVVSRPARARAWGLGQATFRAEPDPETNFTLFRPVARAAASHDPAGDPAGPRALLACIRPNEDICEALETLCRHRGFETACVRGVGSLVGAAFEDGRSVPSHATEVFILHGDVRPGPAGSPEAVLDVALVDMDGAIHEGRLVRGRNAVCMTFELLIEETGRSDEGSGQAGGCDGQ